MQTKQKKMYTTRLKKYMIRSPHVSYNCWLPSQVTVLASAVLRKKVTNTEMLQNQRRFKTSNAFESFNRTSPVQVN